VRKKKGGWGVIVRNRITKDLRRFLSELAYGSYNAAIAKYPIYFV
jgi:hypothetical protein